MDESKKIPKNFCVMPFVGGIIKYNGDIDVCCQIEKNNKNNFNIKTDSFKKWTKSNYRIDLQKDFLSNKKPEACKNCWNTELQGSNSLRKLKNNEYKINYFKNIEKFLKRYPLAHDPIEWEMQITNLCNLKCQMCSGSNSSKLLAENQKIYKTKGLSLAEHEKKELVLKQADFDVDDKAVEHISEILREKIRLINFRGGETFLVPRIKQLLKILIEQGNSKNLILHITTNGTIVDDDILRLLEKFKKIRLMLSIESTDQQNDYIRFPSKWKEIEKNIKRFQTLTNIEFYVFTVVTNLSLLNIDKLIKFSIKNNFFTNLCITNYPDYMNFDVLPLNILKLSLDKLLKLKLEVSKFSKIDNFDTLINRLNKKIETYSLDKDKWKKFVKIIQLRDQYRKVTIQDYVPELAKHIYN